MPAANLEPYYTGWNHASIARWRDRGRELRRDNYFARAMMYGSVLSGALAGTCTARPLRRHEHRRTAGWRPHIWTALRYESGRADAAPALFRAVGGRSLPGSAVGLDDLEPRSIPDAPADGLDGWSFLMRTADKHVRAGVFRGTRASRLD
jgi:hypothetical protein